MSRWDNRPVMLASRLGVRSPAEASGHDDVRHDPLHRRMYSELVAHLQPCWDRDVIRCACDGRVVGDPCCNRADQEDGLCTACRRYCSPVAASVLGSGETE